VDKLAIVTLVTNAQWQELADLTLPSQRRYAERLGADFLLLDKTVYPHPHYDKWQIHELFATYDRLIYLDADMVVRPDCPDLFASVPPEAVGGENELLSVPVQAQHLARFCQRLGLAPLPCPFYLNGGLFVASRRHRDVFRPPEAVVTDLPWPEQSHFNARLIAGKHPVFFLPAAFNDRHRRADYLRRSYILHYACLPHQARLAAVRRDLEAWDQLFRRDAPPGAAPAPPPPPAPPAEPDRDYVSPGLEKVACDAFFPNLVVGNKAACTWPYLRRDVPHHWYVDRRLPGMGFLNRDEAHLLYNAALPFRGQPALEIGCWLGWSTCHLALAGVRLDVIDPFLARGDVQASVAAALEAAGVRQSVNLVPGASPRTVHELAALRKESWSFFFIDGNHEPPHPLQDATACAEHAAENCLMLFHDLASPVVGQALDYLKERGWRTRVYQTMQVMGAAWRGDVAPVEHVPDPAIDWELPAHLARHVEGR
jgi:predicted O-methyltransferase YrrM